jgi:tetratricopeptide (TPR) repeat protein
MAKCLHLAPAWHQRFRVTGSSVAAFAVTAIVLVYYSVRGGSYDIVLRQEEALVIWWILGLGFAFGLLPRARPPRGVLVPLAAILGLALWTAISLTWTQSGERTFAELARFLHYAGLTLLIWAVIDRRTWRAAAAGLLTGAVVVCGLALISRLWPGSFNSNPVVQSFVDNRLSYPFNYWNAVGAFSVMSSAMALTWSAHARRLPARAAALAAVPLCEATAYLTYSRAAAFGSVLCVVLVLLLSRNRWVALVHILGAAAGSALVIAAIRSHHQIVEASGSAGRGTVILALIGGCVIATAVAAATWYLRGDERWRVPRRAARISVAAAVVLVVVLVPTAGHAEISKGWHQFKKHPSSDNQADPASRLSTLNGNRYYIWRSALRAFKAHPIDGTGAGTFAFWWWSHDGDEFLRDAHSLYLEELGEQGIVGGVLILTFVGGLAVVGLRGRRRLPPGDVGLQGAMLAAFGVYLFHAGVDWMWESTAVTVLALSAVAIGIAAVSEPAEARARSRVPLRVGVAGLAVVALLLQLPGLASTLSTRDSQSDFNSGNLHGALGEASDAISEEPWAASPYEQRALVEEAQGSLQAARTDALRAQSREPTNYQHPLVLARIEAELGNANAAVAALKRAKALRPRSPFVQ